MTRREKRKGVDVVEVFIDVNVVLSNVVILKEQKDIKVKARVFKDFL